MRRRLTLVSYASLMAALSVSVATPAQAQIGRIKKIATDAAVNQATGKKPDDPTGAKITYEITNDRVSAIVAGLTPVLAAAQRDADAKAVKDAYETKYKAANDCLNKLQGGSPDLTKMQSKEYMAVTE